ncbi:hypothetical protein E4T56_gene7237 [Termitomyces sp. T112]|nr:hypothetical protein E4T56_gene7237 [Termitomyces sp. T112]
MDVDASHQWSSTPLLCRRCGKAGHFARYCPQGLEVRYLSSSEQEELLAQLLAARNAAGTPSPDAPATVSPTEVRQQMTCTPPLPSANHFAPLFVESNISVAAIDTMPEMISFPSDVQNPPPAKVSVGNMPPSPHPQIPAWERCLSCRYIVASTPSVNSLKLQVEIEMTDTQQVRSVVALLDSGVTGLFFDADYVQQHCLTTRPLSRPIPVYNVDGTLNEAGSIRSVVDLVLRYQDHSERAAFAVTSLGKQDMILGFTWLHEHNPEIDWTKEEAQKEHRVKVRERAAEEDGCEGDFASMRDPESLDETIEVGDRIYAMTLCPSPMIAEIRASQTTSQRLAKAFAANSQPKPSRSIVPHHLHDFKNVFSKASFDSLPERKQWDHAIELIPDAKPSSCKVYPLAPCEQDELDAFLQENLSSGRIRPSKSPMASPVFFIKKKDGSLHLVQDYQVLNAMMLDVRWGYNNVRIKEGDEWKAVFRTNRGLFEPLVMFFGLTNSPATFQTMMNDIFHDLIADSVVCVYLDDILIYTKTLEEHCQITRIVLECLRQHQLYLKPEKSEMDPVKVAGVAEWPEPKNKKEVQAFLGFVNFYRRFIQDFSHHARPLFDLTVKDMAW